MSRIAPEQMTFDFEKDGPQPAGQPPGNAASAQVLSFPAERLRGRELRKEDERDQRLLEESARRVRFF